MKVLVKSRQELQQAGRWDIDFHLPPEGIRAFPVTLLKRVDSVSNISKTKVDPTKEPDESFKYIDISCIDVITGTIQDAQDVLGGEAPSRARMQVRAFDILVSTVRPTRGAVAVVPPHLHNEVASTGFTIVRPSETVNPFYLHYALRLSSTKEQFRKWSTGSSYPAILDEDVAKTLIPIPDLTMQDELARKLMEARALRKRTVSQANSSWVRTLTEVSSSLFVNGYDKHDLFHHNPWGDSVDLDFDVFSRAEITQLLEQLDAEEQEGNATSAGEPDLQIPRAV